MEALFITNLELNENEGIYKKIYAEATAIGKAVGSCNLLMKCGSGTKVVDTLSEKSFHRRVECFNACSEICRREFSQTDLYKVDGPEFFR